MLNLKMGHVWLTVLMALALTEMQASAQIQVLPTSDQPRCSGISRGKHFIVGFSENHESKAYTRELSILVVAFSDQETTVTISSKHQTQGEPFQKTFVVEARGFRKTIVPVELMMEGNERSFKSIDISASSDVSAYGLMYQDHTTDGFLGIPTNNLGEQYVVITQQSTLSSQFSVIGTKDSTSVLVTLRAAVTFEGQTYNAGDVLSFMVNELEAIHIQSPDEQDLTGSIIQSDKAVAVFSGNICGINPGSTCDTLTEQLIPVNSWGQKHIYTAARSTDSNIYRIVPYFSATVVAIPGLANQTLDPGEFWEGSLSGSGLVSSSKPTLMMQQLASINGEVLDPSLIQVPSVEQFDFVFGFTTPPHSGGDSGGFFNFVNIIVKQHSRQTVYLNGYPLSATDVRESDVPNTDYVSLTVQLPKGEGVYFVEQTDPQGPPLSVIVYGYEHDESFGYAAGLSLSSNAQLSILTPYYLRELGGEVFSITVPCLETNLISLQDAKCRFSTGYGDVIVPGIRNGQYSLDCITPTFYKNGLTSVAVSLDDGITFPYSGIVYVASEEDFTPHVTVQQENSENGSGIIDLTSDGLITLFWDPSTLGDGISHVDVMIRNLKTNIDGNPVFMEGVTLMSNALNNGTLTVHPGDFNSDSDDAISLLAIYLTPSQSRIRRDNVFPFLKRLVYSAVKRVIRRRVGPLLYCLPYHFVLADVATGLSPCPCTSDQANVDSLNFEKSNFGLSFFHPGAENCYRSTTSSSTGSGQQCCYGADGNILLGPPGGGTADRYSPGDHFWKHQLYDVLPWLACCWLEEFSANCRKYYRQRPSDDCSEYEPPQPAGGTGDPHITSLDGNKFTFNGAGEFLMASSELHNLTFQARMERFRRTNASVYTSFVIQTNESARVQVQMSNEDKTMILVDGEQLRIESSPILVHHLKGVRISFNSDVSEVRLAFSAGVAVIVYIDPEVMSFIAQLDRKFQDQVRGLLGNLNRDPDDDLQFPNGTILKTGPSLQDIHKLALEWLVTKGSSIFTYISPYDYSSYHFPNFAATFNVPDKNAVSQEIKDLCGESIDCLFDAVVTGSLSFANKTQMVSGTLKTIQKAAVKIVSCGFPGEIENGTTSGSVYLVNATVSATCENGFTLKGASKLTCQETGQWSSNLPLCVDSSKSGASKSSCAFSSWLAVMVVAFGHAYIV